MKKGLSIFLSILFAILLWPNTSAMASSAKTITISLPQNPSTGYTWQYAFSQKNILKQTSDDFILNPTAQGTNNTDGTHTWTFQIRKAGDVTLTFVSARHFNPAEKPVRVISYTYRVSKTGYALLYTSDITDNISLSFDANETTGYQWRYTLDKEGVIAEKSNQYVTNDNPQGLTGVGGTHIFTFKGLAPGEVTALFTYARSWETGSPDENLPFTFQVAQDGSITLKDLVMPPVYNPADKKAQDPANIPLKKLALSAAAKTLMVEQTLPTQITLSPGNARINAFTYKSSNVKVATVDQNGVITGHKAGKATISVTMSGSKKKGSFTVKVEQPPTGINFTYPDVRVGVNRYANINAVLEPKDALKNAVVVWTSDDESIVTVSGTTTKAKITGHQWGRATLTATIEGTNYSAKKNVNVGSLLQVVKVQSIRVKDGKPSILLKNQSNMNLTQVRFELMGYDINNNPIPMSTQGDILMGSYNNPLAPEEETEHGLFTFYHKSDFAGLHKVAIAISGFMTDTGYYATSGKLLHDYNVDEKDLKWIESKVD